MEKYPSANVYDSDHHMTDNEKTITSCDSCHNETLYDKFEQCNH